MSLNHSVDAAGYSSVGSIGIGVQGHTGTLGYPQPAVMNTNYPQPSETWQPNRYDFRVNKVENGWTIGIGHKTWVCTTPQELGDRMVAILVEERLDK